MYTYIYIYIYIHTHTCIHLHIHIHTHTHGLTRLSTPAVEKRERAVALETARSRVHLTYTHEGDALQEKKQRRLSQHVHIYDNYTNVSNEVNPRDVCGRVCERVCVCVRVRTPKP